MVDMTNPWRSVAEEVVKQQAAAGQQVIVVLGA